MAEVPPSHEMILLSRCTFGALADDFQQVQKLGIEKYINEQLNSKREDNVCDQKIQKTTLHIEYEQGKNYLAKKEDRLLENLDKPLKELWKLGDYRNEIAYEEKIRPLQEVRMATLIRAVYSKWQLREILVEFWHNHFHVNGFREEAIAATFPVYDREVIRRHCMGNFREFLEAVAQSTAMQYYLNNVHSKASPANENYARELFELHTLGAPNYLNHLYNRWREVPGATKGSPTGYIDQDVYEAARAFTGWTIANGEDNGKGEAFPNTGEFQYCDGWHDHYQKRVLGMEFDPYQSKLADGRKVLDLVAKHPATANYICTKLCRRFLSDDPPKAAIDRAVLTWMENQNKSDQIKQTVKTILLSPEMKDSWQQKVKRPLELLASFLRVTKSDFSPNLDLIYTLSNMGLYLFEWPTPTGHPDTSSYWLSSNFMLNRWNTLWGLMNESYGKSWFSLLPQMSIQGITPNQIVKFWTKRMLIQNLNLEAYHDIVQYASQGEDPDHPLSGSDEEIENRVRQIVAIIAMTPNFQFR